MGGRMSIPGHTDYKRREYCKDIACPVQIELETHEPGSSPSGTGEAGRKLPGSSPSGTGEAGRKLPGSDGYESVRGRCKSACIHTTYEFHHWLIEHGYLLVRPEA